MESDPFITIGMPLGPLEADMTVALLAEEGITALTPGNRHSALLGGMASSALGVPLKVRQSDAERAMAILDALECQSEIAPEDALPGPASTAEAGGQGGPYRGLATERQDLPRRPMVAFGAALMLSLVLGLFGSGHFYVQRYGVGMALLALGWSIIALAIRQDAPALLIFLPLVALVDGIWAHRVASASGEPSERA